MRFVAMATSRSAGAATTSKAAARPAGAALRKASAARIMPRASSAAAATAEASLDVTKMAPLGDRLLVRPRPAEEKSAGGVILSAGLSSGTTMPMQDALVGTVIAVGEEVALEGVAVGDAVLFSKYSSSDVSLPDGGEVCFVAEKSVLAKLS